MESADGAGPRARSGFDRFLNPRAVAVVGASQDLSRIGGQPLKLLTEFGYGGKVYPVNPKYPEIHGLACYPDVKAVPQPCDLALIALSARHVVPAIEQCGEAGIPYAIVLSAGFMGAGGAFYVQVFQYIDPAIAFGPPSSIEALVAAIVGGMGTLWGPLLGAAVLHLMAEATRNLFGQLPGLNMVIYGTVLVLIVMFLPRGLSGAGRSVRELLRGRRG